MQMQKAYLAWRHPNRRWFPVGVLSFESGLYAFAYLQGAIDAQNEGFRPLWMFPDLRERYCSRELFPVFENRVPADDDPRRATFMSWLNLPSSAGAVEALGRSEGRRTTDTFELFSSPSRDGGVYRMCCFVHGLQHRGEEVSAIAMKLKPGMPLELVRDPENPHDKFAVQVHTDQAIQLGFIPRYLTADVARLFEHGDVKARVRLVNPPPVPVQFRVLCELEAPWPAGFEPFTDSVFAEIAPANAGTCPPALAQSRG